MFKEKALGLHHQKKSLLQISGVQLEEIVNTWSFTVDILSTAVALQLGYCDAQKSNHALIRNPFQ